MDNKETIVRDTHYEYDKDGNLTSMTIGETITNPHADPCENCPCEEGALLTDEIEFTRDEPTFADAALALAGLGLCLTALATIFKRR